MQCSTKPQPVQYNILHCSQCIISYNALAAVSAAVLYTNYSSHGTFELPTQSGTLFDKTVLYPAEFNKTE